MPLIVIATGNPHKVEELRAIFARVGLRVLGLSEAVGAGTAPPPEPDEHGTTFEQNAEIKAVAYARSIGSPCLADDSGLQIDALGGAPGVISSHYCSDGREVGMSRNERDAANNERVLRELTDVPDFRRGARFVCAMCLAAPDGRVLARSRAEFEGRIGRPPRVPSGVNGFGYDPIFLVAPELSRTGAELTSDEKNSLSHRAQAAVRLAGLVRTLSLP